MNRKNVHYFLFFIILAIGYIVCSWLLFISRPLISSTEQSRSFVFISGSSVKTLSSQLQHMGIVKHPVLVVLLAKLKGMDRLLQAGEYQIDPQMTIGDLLGKMVRGESIRHVFTLVEGWTFSQTLAALGSNPYIVHTIGNLNDAAVMEKLGYGGETAEGRFAPDTYVFSGKINDLDVLRNAYILMQKRIDTAWQVRDVNAPYTCPYKALIVASLIEKETAVDSEKPRIAGVIIRRLNKGMFLDIDASVIYGLGKNYTGKLTRRDLTIPTSYNTYLKKDLPPTPICMPSESSIQAALHPSYGTELYYVAKGDDGTHVFSNTLEEHNTAVSKLRKK